MRGLEKYYIKLGTDIYIDGHRDSMIESAQWADSMKIGTDRELEKLWRNAAEVNSDHFLQSICPIVL